VEPEIRRRQILDAARATFAAKGYHAASVRDIIGGAGIARGTFYLYFDSKRAILDELVDEFLAALQACIRGVRLGREAASPYDQLRGNLSRVLRLLLDEREMVVVLLHHATGLDARSDAKLDDFWSSIAGALERALVTGQRLGLVAPADPAIAARLVLGGFKELAHHLVVQPDAPRIDPGELVDSTLRIALTGVLRGPLHPLLAPIASQGPADVPEARS
jgi:AcrR family transcriptional regulator